MDNFTGEVFLKCLGVGILISLPIRWLLLPLSKKTPKRSQETKYLTWLLFSEVSRSVCMGIISHQYKEVGI
jgi:hypothetical protein